MATESRSAGTASGAATASTRGWRRTGSRRNVEGIAIEHGQDNRITENRFDGDETAIRLWKNPTQDPNWEYPKTRDTRSRDYVDRRQHLRAAIRSRSKITETQNVRVLTNGFEKVGTVAVLAGDTRNFGVGDEVSGADPAAVDARRHAAEADRPAASTPRSPTPSGAAATRSSSTSGGRTTGSRRSCGRPAGRTRAAEAARAGPAGEWKVASVRGATVEPPNGRVPGAITVTAGRRRRRPSDYRRGAASYRGGAVVGPRGLSATPAGCAIHVRLLAILRAGRLAGALLRPSTRRRARRSSRMRSRASSRAAGEDRAARPARLHVGRSDRGGVPRDRVAIVAEGTVDLPPGRLYLRTISDDGLRVWMDDERMIDHWTPHESAVDTAPITGGKRRFKVEYYEIGGFAELRFEISEAMMNWLTDPEIWIALATLTFLEIVLGVDNIIFISILSGKLPPEQQPRARRLGLLARDGHADRCCCFSLAWIVRLTGPLVHGARVTRSPAAI